MKQIIVVTNAKEQYGKDFVRKDLHVTWCTTDTTELIKLRGRSSAVFVCTDHEERPKLEKLGMYLRDLCIEDEKTVYLYGNMEDVNLLASLIPSLYIRNKAYSFSPLERFVSELEHDDPESEVEKPCLLVIDEDSEYTERLRLHLDPSFRILVSTFDPDEIDKFMELANVTLISTDAKLKLFDIMRLVRKLLERRQNPGFKYYFIAPTNEARNVINSESEKNGITLSKEMDPARVAGFIVNQYRLLDFLP
ncbi:MAG: hypothetical protein K6F87_04140 [Lachnospiraceae bacterium]|nr:hypothetical protein [Lachnospiraceae bacterium]